MAKEIIPVEQIDEQLFTEFTPEQGSTVAGGFFGKKTYKFTNKIHGDKFIFGFNHKFKSIKPGQTITHKSRLPRGLVTWDKDPSFGFKLGKKLVKKGHYVFKKVHGLRELFRV